MHAHNPSVHLPRWVGAVFACATVLFGRIPTACADEHNHLYHPQEEVPVIYTAWNKCQYSFSAAWHWLQMCTLYDGWPLLRKFRLYYGWTQSDRITIDKKHTATTRCRFAKDPSPRLHTTMKHWAKRFRFCLLNVYCTHWTSVLHISWQDTGTSAKCLVHVANSFLHYNLAMLLRNMEIVRYTVVMLVIWCS